MITKTVSKIEIRVEFMKIRGDLVNKSVEMQVRSHLLRRYGRMILDHRQKNVPNVLSNRLCTFICNGFIQQIPPYFHEFNSDFNLKTVLVIIFREVSAYANETRVGNGCDIAMAHCRSFPGFQMMELVLEPRA